MSSITRKGFYNECLCTIAIPFLALLANSFRLVPLRLVLLTISSLLLAVATVGSDPALLVG